APLEALKAQAVTARGEVFSKLGHRHFSEPFHLCSEQHCQVYAGAKRERAATNRAVAETRGLLAVRPRADPKAPLKLVDSVYSSTCGGFTEDNEIVWNSPASESLRSKLDGNPNDPALAPFRNGLNESNIRAWLEAYPPTYDARSSFTKPSKYRWKKKISGTKLNAMVRAHKVGFLRDIHILGRGRGGRVTGIRLVGTLGSSDVLRELPVRRLFGNLNSGMFVVDLERYANGNIYSAEFIGGGWGHGVGMCQMGAIGRAQANQTFQQILEHYYNGATVEKLY
ncbi:MAG: SpoIID/LytB domain-containing protein, partial [Myxococcota bacterium]